MKEYGCSNHIIELIKTKNSELKEFYQRFLFLQVVIPVPRIFLQNILLSKQLIMLITQKLRYYRYYRLLCVWLIKSLKYISMSPKISTTNWFKCFDAMWMVKKVVLRICVGVKFLKDT